MVAQEVKTDASPSSIAIVVDCSGSLRLQLDKTVSLVKQIAESMQSGDEAFIIRFVGADKITVTQDFTQSKSDLADAADDLYIEGGQTAITEAVEFAAKHFGESPIKNPQRTIILISDGDERKNSATEGVLNLLKDEKIRVFAIGISDLTVLPKVLERFTKETAGKTFVPRSPAELSNAVVSIMAALRGERTGK
ncbi:MAG TPA: VWA domain-containing protein [Pyrinomonadaceae bacterium]